MAPHPAVDPMPYHVLADGVVIIHFGFLLFVVFGGLLVRKFPRIAWLHLPAAAWGAMIEFAGWICPLTPLENYLRDRAGAATYGQGFIERYLTQVLYPEGLTRTIQIGLGIAVIALNLIIYWRAFHPRTL